MKTTSETLSAPTATPRVRAGSRGGAYLELTKPRLNSLVLVTTAIGYYLGERTGFDFWRFFHTLLGTSLVAGAASTLNQYWERAEEGLMERTKDRPIPSGRLQPAAALAFGIVLALLGLADLAVMTNWLTAVLAALTLGSYLFVYTPLKRVTSWCTVMGAVPGAIPPMLGWASARGELGAPAWILFAILFCWQMPHFFAIAWMWREDYKRAGYPMLTVVDPSGRRAVRQAVLWTLALLVATSLPYGYHMAGRIYLVGELMLGLGILYFALRLARQITDANARRLFFASILYLPFLLILLVVCAKGGKPSF